MSKLISRECTTSNNCGLLHNPSSRSTTLLRRVFGIVVKYESDVLLINLRSQRNFKFDLILIVFLKTIILTLNDTIFSSGRLCFLLRYL